MALGTDALEEPSGHSFDQTEMMEEEGGLSTWSLDESQVVHRKSTTFERDDKNVTTWKSNERERSIGKSKSQPLPG